MSWRDRATPANAAPTGGGSWRDRATPVQPQGDYWGDVKENAIEGLKQTPEMLKGMGQAASDVGNLMNPITVGKSMFQASQGVPLQQTPTGQAAQGVRNAAAGAAEGLWQGVKDTAKIPYAGVEMLGGTPMAETKMGQTFRERPISMPFGVASTVFPAAKVAKAGGRWAGARFAGESPNFLEKAGARGVNKALEIDPRTIKEMTPRNQPVGDFGVKLGMELGDEGFAGLDPSAAEKLALKTHGEAGKGVGTALKNIKDANKAFKDLYPGIDDPLKVDANRVLKPFIDKANQLRESKYPNERFESRYHRAPYESLSEAAKKRGGFLGIDDVRSEMQKVGKMLESASEQTEPILKKVYGELAGLQDDMITEIAELAGDDTLKNALLDANKKYSRYSRILPDIRKAASKQSAGKGMDLSEPLKSTVKAANPRLAQATLAAGKGLRKGAKMFQDVTEAPGKAMTSIFKKGKQVAGDERGSIFPTQELKPVQPGAKSGSPHALLAYEDDFGPGGTRRKIYNVFGDPNDPAVQRAGWGSSLPEERLRELGIPIMGKEVGRFK